MEKRRLVAIGAVILAVSSCAYALSYSHFYGSPSEYDLAEMSEALENAVRTINDLEDRVSSLESEISDLESRIRFCLNYSSGYSLA